MSESKTLIQSTEIKNSKGIKKKKKRSVLPQPLLALFFLLVPSFSSFPHSDVLLPARQENTMTLIKTPLVQ